MAALTGVFSAPRHMLALLRIGFILIRADILVPLADVYGFGRSARFLRFFLRPARAVSGMRPGQRLGWALHRLGPSFIKLGQALSTRSDLLGDQAEDLSQLQDRLPPFPAAEAIRAVETELELPLAAVFSEFDGMPVAAASVAQVHFAVTTDGREVAVKILRPGVEAAFARDLDLFAWIAETVERAFPELRRLRPREVVREFAISVGFEMDLRMEAAAAAEMADNFRGDPDFRVPKIDWQRTGKRILTTERVHGIPIDEAAALRVAGHDARDLVTKASRTLFAMIFRDGFFHADLHPGNLFIDAQGMIVGVDFGLVGRIDRESRNFIADMLLGFLTGDYRRVAEVHFAAGLVPANESVASFTQACRSIGEPLLGRPLEEISLARLLAQLFRITRQFNMETQPQLLTLQKTLVLAEGLGRALDPSVNMWLLAGPLIEEWMAVHRSPPARIAEAIGNVIDGVERLPRLLTDVERVFNRLAKTPVQPPAERGFRPAALAVPLWLIAITLIYLALRR